MKKQRGSSLAPLPAPKEQSRINNFRSARHSHVEPSKRFNQYLVRHADYSSANDGFHSKKKSHAGSEADKDSNHNPLEERLMKAV